MGLPWLRLDLAVPYGEMLAEAEAIRGMFVPHREGVSSGWFSLCVHGLSATQTGPHEQYGFPIFETAPYTWTEVADRCPTTAAFFRDVLPMAPYARVRFMLLEPGGWIETHIDTQRPGLRNVNIALSNPEGCEFYVEGHGVVPFEPGAAFMVDVSLPHRVTNRSSTPRMHMIAHGGHRDPRWGELVERSYAAQ